MKTKRLIIATIFGIISGFICFFLASSGGNQLGLMLTINIILGRTLIGVAIGIWLDIRYPGQISWTITFLFAGLAVGCFNAWYWVERERKKIDGYYEESQESGHAGSESDE